MKVASIFISFLIASTAFAVNQEVEEKRQNIEILKAVLENTTEKIPVTEVINTMETKVLVGSDYHGFEEKNVEKKGKTITFVPITYKEEIVIKTFDGKVLLKKKYENKIPQYFYEKHLSTEKKKFSSRYMFLSSKEEDLGHSFFYIYILNRAGEPIWFYVPKNANFEKVNYISPKIKDDTIFLILKGRESMLNQIDWYGRVLFQVKNTDFAPSKKFHHDFVLKRDKILFLTQHKGFVRTNLLKKPSPIIYDELIEFDIKRRKYQIVWKSLDHFVPLGRKYKRDFTHSNSLALAPDGGVLISVRNQSTLVKLDKSYNFQWSLGRNGMIKPATKEDIFSMEHDAHFLDEKTIILFDNHRNVKKGSFSRGVILTFDEKKKKFWIKRKFFPKKKIFARNRSSFSKLKNGNYLAMFILTGSPFDVIVEFDGKSGEEIENLKMGHFAKDSGAFRSYPFNSINIKENKHD